MTSNLLFKANTKVSLDGSPYIRNGRILHDNFENLHYTFADYALPFSPILYAVFDVEIGATSGPAPDVYKLTFVFALNSKLLVILHEN